MICATASAYKRDDKLVWYAAPPVHVTQPDAPVHSVAYLNWKKEQQQNQQQQQQQH